MTKKLRELAEMEDLTVDAILGAKKLLDKNDKDFGVKEFYYPQWKNPSHPLYEICTERVAAGIGVWLEDDAAKKLGEG